MRFLFPLGLYGLFAIPVVILIYILQSIYTEQTVNSNYLWHLSNKFMKRRNPLSGIKGLISLILQILTIAVLSFALARPIIILPNAANEYCFVLDVSSSMGMQDGDSTRLEKAKDEIKAVIEKSKKGSTYSLVCVSSDTERTFDFVTDKKTAYALIDEVGVTQAHLDTSRALSVAQSAFELNNATEVYFVTDKDYEIHENVNIIDVGTTNLENYAIFDVSYSHSGGKLTVKADVISYNSDTTLNVKLTVDGTTPVEDSFEVKAGVLTEVSLTKTCDYFASFNIEITNSDGYMLDNSISSYNAKSEKTYSILIVSEEPFFFRAVVDSLIDSQIDIVDPDEYEDVTEKYGLYIFDSCEPKTLPEGAVWFINPEQNIENSGFAVRGKVAITGGDVIKKSTSSSTAVRKLLTGVGNSEISIKNYMKYSVYAEHSVLYTYNSMPMVFTCLNSTGNRQAVFAFDFHESDIALSTDFVILFRNLLEYSFPNVIDETNYMVGDDAIVNIVSNADNLKAISPSGKNIYVDAGGATAEIYLDEVGTYVLSMTLSGQDVSYRFFSSAHKLESEPVSTEAEFSLPGEKEKSQLDGEFDPLTVLFIALAVLFIADWGVYCYEKYQLR